MDTILIADDTKANIKILMELLGDSYDLLVAKDGKSAIEIACEENPDLILLDILMPKMDGFEVCKELKKNAKLNDVPIIFLTAKTDEDSIETAYDLGGCDYVTKPFRPKELRAKVKRELHLKKLQNELNLLASTDSLTKLYNRRYFTKVSNNILELLKRDKKNLSLIMMDIDKFKTINDSYGHKTGDNVLIKFAQILQQIQRKSDISCRFGGEEFVVLLPETDINGAESLAQKIREETENLKMEIEDNKILQFTISLGVSSISIDTETNIEAALNRADKALYKAKNSGRNRVCKS